MDVRDRCVVVTGGGSGIGAALARRFAGAGARGVVVADIDAAAASGVAEPIGATPVEADVSKETDIRRIVDVALDAHGRIDLFCSNAGAGPAAGIDLPNERWHALWELNVMAHVYAARAVLPHMLERGDGYLLQTVSAAGILTNLGAAAYTATKHAALGLAEWLSVTYGNRGIRVSALCPQFVDTPLLDDLAADPAVAAWVATTTIDPETVAEAAIEGIGEERFLILPHPEVAEYARRKATDPDRWLAGMRRLQATVFD